MKVAIVGPITGRENYMEAFSAATRALVRLGHQPINPVARRVEDGTVQKGWAAIMEACLRDLLDAQGFTVLPGWDSNRGSVAEVILARATSKRYIETEVSVSIQDLEAAVVTVSFRDSLKLENPGLSERYLARRTVEQIEAEWEGSSAYGT